MDSTERELLEDASAAVAKAARRREAARQALAREEAEWARSAAAEHAVQVQGAANSDGAQGGGLSPAARAWMERRGLSACDGAWLRRVRRAQRTSRGQALAELRGGTAGEAAGFSSDESAAESLVEESPPHATPMPNGIGGGGGGGDGGGGDAAPPRPRGGVLRASEHGRLRWWEAAGEAARAEAEGSARERAAQRGAYEALEGEAGAACQVGRWRMELAAAEKGERKVLRLESGWLSKAMTEAAKAAAGGGSELAAADAAAVEAQLEARQALLRRRSEATVRRWAHRSARLSERSVLEEAELYKLSRALPEEVSAAALEAAGAAADRMASKCRQVDAQVRRLHELRLRELRCDRAAWRPPSDGEPAPLRLLLRSTDPHAVAAPAAAHCCAATLALRVALASWMRERRLAADALSGKGAEANALKLAAVVHCARAAGIWRGEVLVAGWLLRELPEAIAVPFDDVTEQVAHEAAAAAGGAPAVAVERGEDGWERGRLPLPDGRVAACVVAVPDEKEAVWDGAAMVSGKYDGESSGASFEPGPWRWEARSQRWRRDSHPHDVLVTAPCGHAFSEHFWSAKLSTRIEQSRGRRWKVHSARCCAPLPGGGTCSQPLRLVAGMRLTACNPPRAPPRPVGGGWAELRPRFAAQAVHGSLGSRVETALRLLLALKAHAAESGMPPAAAKAVVFSRHEATLSLLRHGCALNGISAVSLSAACGSFVGTSGRAGATTQEVARFCTDESIQALLLSAARNAAGLTLTAASHVLILEPQPALHTELQMIGRIHRIGQAAQTHVWRLAVQGAAEAAVAQHRAEAPSANPRQPGDASDPGTTTSCSRAEPDAAEPRTGSSSVDLD